MRLRNLKYFYCILILMGIYYFFGIGDHIRAKSYKDNFDYPLNVDIKPLVQEVLTGRVPSIKPINRYPYKYIKSCSEKCEGIKPYLLILVKSAIANFNRRLAIRQTWGSESRFPYLKIRVLFYLGISESPSINIQNKIDNESLKFRDIVQFDFIDNYFNNTIKTMMMFRWGYEFCPDSEFYFFSDDDMYVSVLNILKYLNNSKIYSKSIATNTNYTYFNNNMENILFVGYVFKSGPHRHIISKWHVSLKEYPWDMWPPYVTAGAYIVSMKTLKMLYLGSLFVKHFRFDDIYLGIVARKLDLTPMHCPDFYFYKKHYSVDNYKNVIACHGYGNTDELIRVWNKQNEAGFA